MSEQKKELISEEQYRRFVEALAKFLERVKKGEEIVEQKPVEARDVMRSKNYGIVNVLVNLLRYIECSLSDGCDCSKIELDQELREAADKLVNAVVDLVEDIAWEKAKQLLRDYHRRGEYALED